MRKIKIIGSLILVVLIIIGIIYIKSDDYSFIDYDKYIKNVSYKDIKGLKYDSDIVISDKEVQEEINKKLKKTKIKNTKGIVKNGDTVFISYSGTIDGKSFPGSSASNQPLTIGSGSIKEFEKEIKGRKVGETVKIKVDFPGDYSNKNIAGRTAKYEVSINYIQTVSKKKYDDAFVESQGFKSKEDYEKSIKQELIKARNETRLQSMQEYAWSIVVSDTEVIHYPKKLLEKISHSQIDIHHGIANAHKMKWDEYLTNYLRIDKNEFNKYVLSQSKEVLKERMIAHKIAKKEKISIPGKEYREWKKQYLEDLNLSEESFEKEYGISFSDYEKKNDLKSEALIGKVKECIANTLK